MTEHTKTPWKVFTTPDGRKLVGIGAENGEGILDCGFGVWSWNDPEGIANAELVVKAVNSYEAMVKSLEMIEYVSRKDSLTDNERLQSVRTVVCAALSRVGAVVGGSSNP